MTGPHNIAWIDLETTGLDERDGSILEVGIIVTDPSGHPLHQNGILVSPDPAHLAALPPEVYDMHRTSGLLADLEAFADEMPSPADVDRELTHTLDPYCVDGRIVLAGSGVGHFDARWIRHHLPQTYRRLTYWHFDVGVVRRFLSSIDPDLRYPTPDKAHRALIDARDHLNEWQHYRSTLRRALTPTRSPTGRDPMHPDTPLTPTPIDVHPATGRAPLKDRR